MTTPDGTPEDRAGGWTPGDRLDQTDNSGEAGQPFAPQSRRYLPPRTATRRRPAGFREPAYWVWDGDDV